MSRTIQLAGIRRTGIRQAMCACLMLAAFAAQASAQAETGTAGTLPAQDARPTEQTTSDESFELNIDERRINERDFEASTSIEFGGEGARGLNLGVGVAVRASEIDVLLRNVRGRVRFRATLEPLLRRIRRIEPQPQASPASP